MKFKTKVRTRISILSIVVVLIGIASYVIYQYVYEKRKVKVYFVDKKLINIPPFEVKGMVKPVTRNVRSIPKTEAVVKATIEELLKGPTSEEKAQGYMTAIPSQKEISRPVHPRPYSYGRIKLLNLNIKNKKAYVDFSNELEAYGGGSLVAGLISWQIVKTLTQFPAVDKVKLSIEGRTEGILQP